MWSCDQEPDTIKRIRTEQTIAQQWSGQRTSSKGQRDAAGNRNQGRQRKCRNTTVPPNTTSRLELHVLQGACRESDSESNVERSREPSCMAELVNAGHVTLHHQTVGRSEPRCNCGRAKPMWASNPQPRRLTTAASEWCVRQTHQGKSSFTTGAIGPSSPSALREAPAGLSLFSQRVRPAALHEHSGVSATMIGSSFLC